MLTIFLHFVAHSVNLLDIGKYHLGINPLFRNHVVHVVSCKEIRNTSKSLSGLECKFEVLLDVVCRQFVVVKCMWEEIVNKSTEGESIGPGVGEVLYPDVLVVPGPALAPDHDSLHLGRHHLESRTLWPDDAELQSHAGVGRHAATLAVRV